MPTISIFFGIVIKMFFDEHNPPHFHAEHQGEKAVFDFRGNMLRGDISSRTAVRLIREWVDLHQEELNKNWVEMQEGREFKRIDPLT
ncbi:DUF4160 domain-containing protein [soil metagenome]